LATVSKLGSGLILMMKILSRAKYSIKSKKSGRFGAAFPAYAHRSDDDWEYLYEDSRFKANPCI